MEFQKLIYLESIYRLHSFTKAAEENHISQPSITNAIQKLEEELNCELIQRKSKPLQFTSEGQRFMSHVYNILQAVDDAYRDMNLLKSNRNNRLNIACSSYVRNWFLPLVYTGFLKRYPQIDINISEPTLESSLLELEDGRLDFLYTLFPDHLNLEEFEVKLVQKCQLGLIMRKGDVLESMNTISLDVLRHKNVYLYPKGSIVRSKIEKEFSACHIVPHILTISQSDLMQQMTEMGMGYSFVVTDAFGNINLSDGLTFRPLKKPVELWQAFIWKRGHTLSKNALNMIEYIENFFKQKSY
ncbi:MULTISPECIES: LysR family transcriptional regulator [Faecalicoccus]|uniref:LysR family transcriptional regulator n=1 Tax=Faecalicoccus TaxID=1573536 RepID=UPI0025E9EB20|nr:MULTISPECIES: LysR family transcriptional regulator [Faecalicoccus]MDY4279267.1 LysR family transcriptional regulator [Faecalicoccus sp.]MDY4869938.1 LysR family transcriptional regulator [Faecalicoccus sp.]MDY5111196.1 LysR family transcriptional regulator [Faecalicoccus sp.]